jgi:hypothetical protein
MSGKTLRTAALAVVAVAVGIQFIRPARTNPPADPAASFEAVAKPSPQAATLVRRACYDCHSNQTVWPWYARVAPSSWLVADDVRDGRAHLNLSEWNRLSPEMSRIRMGAMCEEMRKGEMPLWHYVPLHPEAKLSSEDIAAFCAAAGH